MGGAPCAETLFIGQLTRNCGNVTRLLCLWSSYRELAGGGGSVGWYAGSWSNIQGLTRNRENEGTTDNLRCMLYSVYAALSVNSWWWHGEIEMNDWTLYSCDDGRVVDKKERDGGWRWKRYGGYKWLWEIRSTTCQIGLRRGFIGFRRPRIGVSSRRIRTCTCRVGDGQLTRTRNSLKSQFLMMISPISSDLSLSCAQLYHHLRTRS